MAEPPDLEIRPAAREIDRQEAQIQRAFLRSMERLRQLRSEQDLIFSSDILEAYPEGEVQDAIDPLAASIAAAALAGALFASDRRPVLNLDGNTVSFVFDPSNQAVTQFANSISADRVREVSNSVRLTIAAAVRDGITSGADEQSIARSVRRSIGLTESQRRAVVNFERMLRNRDRSALTRALRNQEFDEELIRALDLDRPLNEQQIRRMVSAYYSRMVSHRGAVIGRSEAVRAVNGGAFTYFNDLIRRGRIGREQVRRFWHYIPDSRVREAHRTVPARNPNGVGMDEVFQTDLGPMRFPGDPRGIAANVVNCRCALSYQVVDARLIQETA